MQIEGCSTKVRRTRKYDNDDDMNTHRQHLSKKNTLERMTDECRVTKWPPEALNVLKT